MTAAAEPTPTPYEQGLAKGRDIVAARPLPPAVTDRLALLLRPAIHAADHSTRREGRSA